MKIFEILQINGDINLIPIFLYLIPVAVLILIVRIYKQKYLYMNNISKNKNSNNKQGYISKYSEIGIGIGSIIGVVIVILRNDSFWIYLCIGLGGTLGFLMDIYNIKKSKNAI